MSPVKIKTPPVSPDDPRFSVTHRQELIAGFNQAKLTAASGILIGAGGIGGEMGEGLCRKGAGRIRIFDHDFVDPSNLCRQLFFLSDIGRNKAECLARNLAPHCHAGTVLEGYALSFEDAVALNIDMRATFVVCGVDNRETRVAVSKFYRGLAVPVIFIAVDLLAECGQVFVQESKPGKPCFGCAFPGSLSPGGKVPCFAPSSKDALKATAGIGLYAVDSLLMDRRRNWNYRRIHLAGFAPDVITTEERKQDCALCFNPEQGSPAARTTERRVDAGSDSPSPSQ